MRRSIALRFVRLLFLLAFVMVATAYEKSPVVTETIGDDSNGEDIQYLYKVPKLSSGPRALFLLFHGCAHDAFDWFEKDENNCQVFS